MNLTNQPAYQACHPNAVLVTPDFPHCAAALNALFANDIWERDEDTKDTTGDEVDLSTDEALKNFRAGPAEKTRERLRWRAPTETLRGPCSLWKETHKVFDEQRALMWQRADPLQSSEGAPLDEKPADRDLPSTYTAYKLVCEVDTLLDTDLQVLTRIADRHNCALGFEAINSKVLIQLALVR